MAVFFLITDMLSDLRSDHTVGRTPTSSKGVVSLGVVANKVITIIRTWSVSF